MQDQRRRPDQRDDDRAEQREAERERRVEREREHAVRGQQLPARHEERDHRRLGRAEEHGDRRDTATLSTRMNAQRLARQEQSATNAPARSRLVTTRIVPPVEPVDVDAGDGREQHGRQQEGQDQEADRGLRVRRLEDDDGQAEDDHVAADLRERLAEPEQQERAVAEDVEGAGSPSARRRRRSTVRARRAASAGCGVTGAAARRRRSGRGHRAARTRRCGAPATGRSTRTWRPQVVAADADVGAQAVDRARCRRRTDGGAGAGRRRPGAAGARDGLTSRRG